MNSWTSRILGLSLSLVLSSALHLPTPTVAAAAEGGLRESIRRSEAQAEARSRSCWT